MWTDWLVFCDCGLCVCPDSSHNTYHLTWVSLTLDKGYLLTAAHPDLEWRIAPLGSPAPVQPPLLGCGVAPPGRCPWLRVWSISFWLQPLTSDVGYLLSGMLLCSPSQPAWGSRIPSSDCRRIPHLAGTPDPQLCQPQLDAHPGLRLAVSCRITAGMVSWALFTFCSLGPCYYIMVQSSMWYSSKFCLPWIPLFIRLFTFLPCNFFLIDSLFLFYSQTLSCSRYYSAVWCTARRPQKVS